MSDNNINSEDTSKEASKNNSEDNLNSEAPLQVTPKETSENTTQNTELGSQDNSIDNSLKESTVSSGEDMDESSLINEKHSSENLPGKSEETIKDKDELTLQKKQIKESNYQISLINENLLKVNVAAKQGVKINSSVRNRNTSVETQSNEIYLYPKFDYGFQEVEILISIEESADAEEVQNISSGNSNDLNAATEQSKEDEPLVKSNYQINLINENLLKIKLTTEKRVKIDSIVRDKKTSIESQSNKIFLQPKSYNEPQEIEITITIDTEKKEVFQKDSEGHIKLIPNPEVIDLIQPPDYSALIPGAEEYIEDSIGFKKPFDAFRKLIRKNLVIGIIAAVALHAIAAGIFFYNANQTKRAESQLEPSRLIVIQDLPDPKIILEDVEDPMKPKVEEIVIPENEQDKNPDEPRKEFPPRKTVKPPRVNRPNTEDEESTRDSAIKSDLTKELDSLRRLVEGNTIDTAKDTTAIDTSKSAYEIPDSLRNSFNENDIGLAMYFPKNWRLTDERDINRNEKEFKGVFLADTTAEQSGTMTLFIYLDKENKDFNAEEFKTEFKMNDSTLSAFSKEPKTLAGFTEYRFYIFNMLGTEKLSLRASVRKQFFDQYKNEIEAVVRSIRIKKKEDL